MDAVPDLYSYQETVEDRAATGVFYTSEGDAWRLATLTIARHLQHLDDVGELNAAVMRELRVLDPACGTGPLLFAALYTLKAFDRWGVVGSHNLVGIDVDRTALYRLQDWAPDAQIIHGDALLDITWPRVDFIISNPPYVYLKRDTPYGRTEELIEKEGFYQDMAEYFCMYAADQVYQWGTLCAGFLVSSRICSATSEVMQMMQRDSHKLRIGFGTETFQWMNGDARLQCNMFGIERVGSKAPVQMEDDQVEVVYPGLRTDVNMLSLSECSKEAYVRVFLGASEQKRTLDKDGEELQKPDRLYMTGQWMMNGRGPVVCPAHSALSRSPDSVLLNPHRGLEPCLWMATCSVAKYWYWQALDTWRYRASRNIIVLDGSYTLMGIFQSRFMEVWAKAMSYERNEHGTRSYSIYDAVRTFPIPRNLRLFRNQEDLFLDDASDVDRKMQGLELQRLAHFGQERESVVELYNASPEWLRQAHRELDEAVALQLGLPVEWLDKSDSELLVDLEERNRSLARYYTTT